MGSPPVARPWRSCSTAGRSRFASSRVLLAVVISQLIAQAIVVRLIQPNVDGGLVDWLGTLDLRLAGGRSPSSPSAGAPYGANCCASATSSQRTKSSSRIAGTSQQFLRDVTDAFEMSECDTELFDAAAIALGMAARRRLGAARRRRQQRTPHAPRRDCRPPGPRLRRRHAELVPGRSTRQDAAVRRAQRARVVPASARARTCPTMP